MIMGYEYLFIEGESISRPFINHWQMLLVILTDELFKIARVRLNIRKWKHFEDYECDLFTAWRKS